MGNITLDSVLFVGMELVREDRHFTYIGGRTVWLTLDEWSRSVAFMHNCTEACVRRNGHNRHKHAPNILDESK